MEDPTTSSTSTEQQKKEALADFALGKPKIYWVGMPTDFDLYFSKYLKREKDVEILFPGCVITRDYKVYNRTIEKCLEATYGAGCLEKWMKEAEENYEHLKK